jgi:DNA-binding SARP family transcriptional activator
VDYLVLGPVEVWADERPLDLGGAKQRAVLAVLLLNANEVVSSERLIDELWGEQPPATATKLVQGYVVGLRKELGADSIVTRASGYALPVAGAQLDALEFARLTGEAGGQPPARAADTLRAALALWRGPALAGVALEGPGRHQAERLNELRLEALTDRVEADLACGRHRELAGELEALVALHPLRERLSAQLMLALYRSGRQADALRVYRETRRVLTDELGLHPGPELQGLEKAILNQDPALVAPAAPSAGAAASLPSPPTPLTGRNRELREAGALLSGHRLVTLTGPGGSGKTRLALALAGEATADFPDGVHWVSLQALRDPALVVPAVAQATGARGELAEHLRDKRALVVLDNFEHVLAAADEAAALLVAAPQL